MAASLWPSGVRSRVSREAFYAVARSRGFAYMSPAEREAAAVAYDRLGGSGKLHIAASAAIVGDEVLRGPQGHPLPGAPTIVALTSEADPAALAAAGLRPVDGAIYATLREEGPVDSLAAWLPDSPLTVYRTGGPS